MEILNKSLSTLDLAQLIDFRQNVATDTGSVVYEQLCIVGHNLKKNSMSGSLVPMRPTRMNLVMMCLCLRGDITIECDMQRCNVHENSLFICKPGTIIQPIEGNFDELSVLIIDEQYHSSHSFSIQKLLPHYDTLEKLTVIQLEPNDAQRMNTLLGYLSESIKSDSGQLFYHECVKSLLDTLSCEVLRHFSRFVGDRSASAVSHHTRQEVYFREFTNLLGIHFREERRVEYYADRMHITPKYLGTLIVQHTGRSASHWISLYVMSEARALLLNTAMSIQEIAYSLNFPNQSFFGKYFKSHQGVTPGEFRKQKLGV